MNFSEAEKLHFQDNNSICLFFPAREVSPRDKSSVFRVIEDLIDDFPATRRVLTPLTNTNKSLFMIINRNTMNTPLELLHNPSLYSRIYTIFGGNIEVKDIDIESALVIYETFLDKLNRAIPFSGKIEVDIMENIINGFPPNEFLEKIQEMLTNSN